MSIQRSILTKISLCLCLFSLFAAASSILAQNQRLGGNQGAARNFGGGNNGNNGSSSRQYFSPGTVGEALISSDPETRRVIVITDDETSQYVSQVITNLDQPKPQVLIKVVFLEVTYNNDSDIGVEGTLREKLGGSTFGTASNLFGLTPGLPGGSLAGAIPPGVGLYQVLGDDFQVTLRAIATAGKTEVLSRPSILTRNSQPATITVGQTVPLITNVRLTEENTAINTVQYQDVGIILRVTPFIMSNGLVEMIVAPEISSLTDETVPISAGVEAPVIAKRAADTVVVTPNKQTVIIGGLMQNNKITSERKIPFLGDIPGLGLLFKRKIKVDTKTELLIFLTPIIAADPSQLASLSMQEKQAAELVPKAFTPEELDRFVDGLPVKDTSTDANGDAKKKKKR